MSKLPAILQDNRREPVEGETFSSNPAHPFWRVKVRFTTGIQPSLERIRAATAAQALDFVCARYSYASRSGSEVLGRWDPDTAPIDHSHASRSAAEDQPTAAKPKPVACHAPARHAPKAKEKPSLPKFARLPRDCQGRAIMDLTLVPSIAAAHDGGMSWPAIAKALGCGESTLRHKVLDWRRAQAGDQSPGGEVAKAEAPATAAPAAPAPEPPAPAVEAPAPAPEVEAPAPSVEPPATAPTAAPKTTDAPEPPSREAIERLHSIREWDVLADGKVVAQRQPTALADSLTRLLEAAGHRAVAWPSPTPPTPEPTPAPPATVVTTPDGGFLVQVIVKPIQA
jgi:hypothetical protein